jgi:hypothetical protein
MVFLEFALNSCLIYFHKLTGSYGFSLILLSFAVSVCLAPFYYLTGILENKERAIKQRLELFIQKINTIKDSKIRHFQLRELYGSFSYYPFYALRSLASLFIQIPMLFAAYEVLTKNPLHGESFLFASDLGKADSLLFGINLLPMIMTAINIASVLLSAKAGSAERRQGIFIAMLFFFLLYAQNCALLLYWTFNQFFNFVRYLMVCKFPKIKMPSALSFGFAWQFLLVLAIHSILISFVGKKILDVYVIFAALMALIIYKFIKKSKIYFSIPKPETIILNISVMAFPAILIFKSNAVYFDLIDTIIYGAALLLFSIAASFILSPKFSVSFILAIMFLPMVREITHYTSELRIAFWVLFVAALIFTDSVIKQKRAITVFSLVASAYLLFFVGNVNLGSKLLNEKIQIPKELSELELKDSASIYLFMHDAFPHRDYAEHFSLPHYSSLMELFEQSGFKYYDIYSMADATIPTMSSVFDFNIDYLTKIDGITTTGHGNYINALRNTGIQTAISGSGDDDFFREKMAGNNISNILLRNKGYSTGNYNPHDRYISNGENFYDFVGHDETTSMHLLEPKNLIFKNLLKATLNSSMVSATRQYLAKMAEFAQSSSEKSKVFVWGMGCPGHSSLGAMGTTEREIQKFMPIYNKCLAAMKEEIERATSNHNAIIIFMSDHGLFFMDDGYKFPKNYDFNKTDYMKFRDVFGAFMAVRWPNREKAAQYDNEFYVSQDLFPIVFAYLFDSEIPLRYKTKNTELRLGPHKFDKGTFYPYFYKGE